MGDVFVGAYSLDIYDGYMTTHKEMESALNRLRSGFTSLVFERSIHSLKMEWCGHNALYKLGINKDKNKDAFLGVKEDRFYVILGTILYFLA